MVFSRFACLFHLTAFLQGVVPITEGWVNEHWRNLCAECVVHVSNKWQSRARNLDSSGSTASTPSRLNHTGFPTTFSFYKDNFGYSLWDGLGVKAVSAELFKVFH